MWQDYKKHFAKNFGRRVRDVGMEEFNFELIGEEQRGLLKKGLNIDVDAEEMVVNAVRVDGREVKIN